MDEVHANVADALAALIELYEDLKRPLPDVLRPLQTTSTIWLETIVSVEAEFIAA